MKYAVPTPVPMQADEQEVVEQNREQMRIDVCDSRVKMLLNFMNMADLRNEVQKCT
jgi:hypothetical protein